MNHISTFLKETKAILSDINAEVLAYNQDDFWLVQPVYESVEFYAAKKGLTNTMIALSLARGLHDGTYRKSILERNGKLHKQPYLIHPLSVTELLMDLNLQLSKDDEDILLAASMCHDIIEDIPFDHHGKELYEVYHLDPRVYETVLKVSKRKDFTEEEERAFFHGIESDRLALLIKLSDRCNNVEDLYNMKVWKVHEYVGETRKRYFPMIQYGRDHFPELKLSFDVLEDKIYTLTEAADILADRYALKTQELEEDLAKLQEENVSLRNTWQSVWNS